MFYLREFFDSYFLAVGYAAGEAGGGGFVPVGQVEVLSEYADVLLCDVCFDEWAYDFGVVCGVYSWAVVAEVVCVCTGGDVGDVEFFGEVVE